jgi:NDP-sugar pyrophosphorylase family protein
VSSAPHFRVAILAGGLATRLRPLTEIIPKALIDVGGKHFIELQLDLLRRQGYCEVVVCAGYLGEMIEDVIGDGAALGMDVCYSYDGPTLLGTAGSLRKARELLGQAFFVLYGDSYLQCDFAAVESAFVASGKQSLMTVYLNDGRWDTSNVHFVDGKIQRYDKVEKDPSMRHIDYGLGVLSQATLQLVPVDQASDLASLYRQLLQAGELAAFEVRERFFEIGSLDGLAQLREYLQRAPSAAP